MTMTLRDIINKLLRRQPASASTARERLQGEDIPLIDPAEEISGFGAKFRRLMQTKIF